MTNENKQQSLRINEDFSKSYTHERPAPDSNPPIARVIPESNGGSPQSNATQSAQSE